MKKVTALIFGGVAALATSTGAIAAPVVSGAGSPFMTISGSSGAFGNSSVTCPMDVAAPCSFSNTFNFTAPEGFALVSTAIESLAASGNSMTNIDFTSVMLNGVSFNTLSTGQQEFRNLLNQALLFGPNANTLTVMGSSGGGAAFGGNLSFAAASPVPEPATWAFMLIGFGAVGYSLRRRPAYQAIQAV